MAATLNDSARFMVRDRPPVIRNPVIVNLSVTFASPRERSGRRKEVKLDSRLEDIDSGRTPQEKSRKFR
jgi:hypothetical protein